MSARKTLFRPGGMFVRQYTDLQLGNMGPAGFLRAESTRQVYTLDFDNSVELPAETFNASAKAMDIDSTERYLLTGHKDGYWSIVDLWSIDKSGDVACYKLVKNGHQYDKPRYSMNSVFWHIDSGMFSTCSWNGTVNVFDANKTRKPVCTFGVPLRVEYVKHTVNTTNQTIIAATNRTERNVSIIDLRVGCEVQVFEAATNLGASALRFSPTSEHLLSVGYEMGEVLEWDMRSTLKYLHCFENRKLCYVGFPKRITSAHRLIVSSLKYSEDGRHLYTYGIDKNLHKFSTANAKMEETIILDYEAHGAQNLEIHVFENLEDPIVVLPYKQYLHFANMSEGVAKIVAKLKCPQTVHGFTFNRTITKGFSYGKTCSVFAPRGPQNNRERMEDSNTASAVQKSLLPLIDISDL